MRGKRSGIFLSYRREDAGPQAGRVADHLIQRFGESEVFLDVDSVEPGSDFVEVLEDAVRACDVFIAIIGPRWLDATGTGGRRRIDESTDYVRIELEMALRRGVPILPVLVGEASMPGPESLPTTLHSFSRRQALPLRDVSFRADCRALSTIIERMLPAQSQASSHPRSGITAELAYRDRRTRVLSVRLPNEQHQVRVYVGLFGKSQIDVDGVNIVSKTWPSWGGGVDIPIRDGDRTITARLVVDHTDVSGIKALSLLVDGTKVYAD